MFIEIRGWKLGGSFGKDEAKKETALRMLQNGRNSKVEGGCRDRNEEVFGIISALC